MNAKPIIAVGMSGGIDSTMAACLLQKAGHPVIGLTMSIWDGSVPIADTGKSGCFGPGEARDLDKARKNADRLGIPHHVIPLAGDYRRGVLDYFCSEYRCGRTPNPCVVCNQQMKFGLLPERARQMGLEFDLFATGHYVRVQPNPGDGTLCLLRGIDREKDQSYFLARLTQAQLAGLVFPLGNYRKPEVVAMAIEAGFDDLAQEPESQDFIESEDHSPLFSEQDQAPGPIIDSDGRELGRHRGIIHYTIGQREGLGVSSATRLYVKELRPETNTVVLAPREQLLSQAMLVDGMSWIAGTPPAKPTCQIQVRYRHRGVDAHIEQTATDTWKIRFHEPQFAVTPGQAAVCYDGEICLGGGWIVRALN